MEEKIKEVEDKLTNQKYAALHSSMAKSKGTITERITTLKKPGGAKLNMDQKFLKFILLVVGSLTPHKSDEQCADWARAKEPHNIGTANDNHATLPAGV